MGFSAFVVAVWMHVQVSRSVRVVSSKDDLVAESPIVLDTVANEEPSLLQMARHTVRLPSGQHRKNVMQLSLPDVLLYDHLPKAGGSFIRSILVGHFSNTDVKNVAPEHVLAPENVRIVREFEGLTEEDRRYTFTVGSVRNPCDYYVSNWAFWIQNPDYPAEYHNVSEDLNTTEDQRRFEKWLRMMMPDPEPPGVLTARMLESYFTESVANASGRLSNCFNDTSCREANRLIYVAAVASLDPSAVDCWIKVENLTSDFRRCLTLFEQQAGSNIVNWTAFDSLSARREQELQNRMDWSNNGLGTKNSGHQKCNFYFDYEGGRLKDFVYKADFAIFNKFGYQSCCSVDNA
jgi:hypothetical protein